MVACSIEQKYKTNNNFCGEPKTSEAAENINLRQVFTFNETRHPEIPLFNLSMACNHCGEPACLQGCPAGAIKKDSRTGAVTVEPNRCFGCKYCTWACPYDAPRYNRKTGTIEKCDFCIQRLERDEAPACVCSCPTNALQLGEVELDSPMQKPMGFTRTQLQPAIQFKPLRAQQQVPQSTAPPPKKAVEELFESSQQIPQPKISLKSEWALLTFTSIAFILVALLTASVILPFPLNPFIFLGFGAVAMGLSTVHLGKKIRAPYAVRNFSKSWLSREIFLFSLFLGVSFLYLKFFPHWTILGWTCAATGFLSLYAVDRIYQVAMQVTPLNFHSAQSLLNGLYLTGALVGNIFLFVPTGIVKVSLYLYRKQHFKKKGKGIRLPVSILRILFGFVIPLSMFFLFPQNLAEIDIFSVYGILMVCVLLGEIIDRMEYYSELDIVTPRKQMLLDMDFLLKERKRKRKSNQLSDF